MLEVSAGRYGVAIEEALLGIVSAAIEDRLRPVVEVLKTLEARLEKLEPDDAGLTYKQAAAALSVSVKTIGRWVDSNKLTRGGTPRSPRIPRSDVHRFLHGLEPGPGAPTKPVKPEDGPDLTSLARAMLSAGAKRARRV